MAEEITGYSIDELLAISGEEQLAQVHPEDHDRVIRTSGRRGSCCNHCIPRK
jgi:hypothetical protein